MQERGVGVAVSFFSSLMPHRIRSIKFFEPDQAFRGTTVGIGLMKFCLRL